MVDTSLFILGANVDIKNHCRKQIDRVYDIFQKNDTLHQPFN